MAHKDWGASFSAESLIETLAQSAGEGLDSGLPPSHRFLGAVVKSILARATVDAAGRDSSSPSIFFLNVDPSAEPNRPSPTRTLPQGQAELGGKRWYLNMEARFGFGVDHSSTADELMDFARSQEDLREVPTVVFIPNAGASPIVFFEKGVSNEARHRMDYDFQTVAAVTIDDCNAAISRLHEQAMKTPGGIYGSLKLWEDSTRYKPVAGTEKVIQAQVRASLIGAFPGLHATEEEMTPAGRFDVGLVRKSGASFTHIGLLELKVLRQSVPTEESLETGIKQAASYRDRVGSQWAQVCCFDMRNVGPADTDPLEIHRSHANIRSVHLARWQLFPSSARLRDYEDEVARTV